ncbi:hypothetical protein TorRG33x02_088260 [Trema orientale]|uniref:Uncharacterized protein n=1 Tax=Trema orientale TaxID=63057 RepID=A0A2P5FBZ6_TREOI|nr:hypothetical protein TorRG33x02_088260 [Trema orientale]
MDWEAHSGFPPGTSAKYNMLIPTSKIKAGSNDDAKNGTKCETTSETPTNLSAFESTIVPLEPPEALDSFLITSTEPEATAFTAYTIGNTVALKLSTGKTSDLAINAFRFFQTKSTIDETQLDRIAIEFSLSTNLSPANLLIRFESNSWNNLPTDSNATFETASDRSSIFWPIRDHQTETLSSKLTLFSQSVTRSSRARMHPKVSVMENRRLSLGESKQLLISLFESVMSFDNRYDGMAARMERAAAVTSGSGKSKSVRMPVQTVSQRSAVRRVDRMRSKASFLQTAEAGEATISSTADLAMTEMSRPAADCCRAWRRAPDWRRASLERRSAWI